MYGAEPVRVRFDGLPPSYNAVGGRTNPHVIHFEKATWEERLKILLGGIPGTVMEYTKPGTKTVRIEVLVQRWGDLPSRCSRITAEAKLTVPDKRRRDEGNFRTYIEKALGDALMAGGWLEDDQAYPKRMYSFGNVEFEYAKGVEHTDILLFPTPMSRINLDALR